MIRMRVLGAAEIGVGRTKLTPAAERVFALAFYLCVRAGDQVSRDDVAELLWGDGRSAQTRHAFRQMMYRLRRGGFTVDEEGDSLYLDPATVDSDLARVLADGWELSADAAEVTSASRLTPGFAFELNPRFAEWFDTIRARLGAKHRLAALGQIRQARREGRWLEMDKWALQVLASDPLNEEATLSRAESAAMCGSKVVALEIIDEYVEELGERATPLRLPPTVLRRRIAEIASPWLDEPAPEASLVGRSTEMACLTSFVDGSAPGVGKAILLSGPPGVGKTRLALEAINFAQLAGMRIVRARAAVGSAERPLSLLLGLLPELRSLPGAAGCDPSALATLGRLGRQHNSFEPTPVVSEESSLLACVIESTADLLQAVAAERRVFLLLDDMHHCDSVSWRVLQGVVARCCEHPVLWVATTRGEIGSRADDGSHAETQFHLVRVGPLPIDQSSALAVAIRRALALPVSLGDAEAIAATSGGVPLFIRELAARATQSTSADPLPRSLRTLMAFRLNQLSPLALRLLRCCVVLGPFATVPRLRSIVRDDTGVLYESVHDLQQNGILRLSVAGCFELHECWQQCISDGLTGVTRALIAHECATSLTADDPFPADVERSLRAADLFLESADRHIGVSLLIHAAELLHSLGFPLEAAEILRRRAPESLSEADEVRVGLTLARALHRGGVLTDVADVCTKTLVHCENLDPVGRADTLSLVSLRLDSAARLLNPYDDDLARILSLAEDETIPVGRRQEACFAGLRNLFNDRPSTSAAQLYQICRRNASVHGASIVGALAELIYVTEVGDAAETKRLNSLIERLETMEVSLPLRVLSLRFRVYALRWTGRPAEAMALGERAFELASKSGLGHEAMATAMVNSFLLLDEVELDQARIWFGRAAALAPRHLRSGHARMVKHLASRVEMQSGDFGRALSTSNELLLDAPSSRSGQARLVELATHAYCAAMAGDRFDSERILDEALALRDMTAASHGMDYPVEMLLRTLVAVERPSGADHLGEAYARARQKTGLTAPAKFFTSVRNHLLARSLALQPERFS